MQPPSESPEPKFSVLRSLKIGSFHIGSSLTDLLTKAVLNRVLIVELGVAAAPVSLLNALAYFLAPLSLWAGYQSDTRPILGSRRVAYIWLGRLLMLVSLPLLPLAVVAIARDTGSPLGWGLLVVSSLLYGVGQLISGAPFLALVHDSAPYERRGQAVAIVQFMLVVSFAFIPAVYAWLLPTYDPAQLARLVLISMAGAALFWIFSVLGEERRAGAATVGDQEAQEGPPSIRKAFRAIWAEQRTRRYALFLGFAAFFAFMQDNVLEPFGGDVFKLSVGETTRFNAYWGIGVLVGMIATYALTRRRRPEQQVSTTVWGLAMLATPVLLLGVAALTQSLGMVRPVLILFGLGFGVYTVGGVALLMAMSSEQKAGSYLALWSVIQLVGRGAGIAMGGIIRDLGLALSSQFSVAYGAVFLIEALGLFLCILLLVRVDIQGFAAEQRLDRPVDLLATALD